MDREAWRDAWGVRCSCGPTDDWENCNKGCGSFHKDPETDAAILALFMAAGHLDGPCKQGPVLAAGFKAWQRISDEIMFAPDRPDWLPGLPHAIIESLVCVVNDQAQEIKTLKERETKHLAELRSIRKVIGAAYGTARGAEQRRE